jgi:hypothetical protein
MPWVKLGEDGYEAPSCCAKCGYEGFDREHKPILKIDDISFYSLTCQSCGHLHSLPSKVWSGPLPKVYTQEEWDAKQGALG